MINPTTPTANQTAPATSGGPTKAAANRPPVPEPLELLLNCTQSVAHQHRIPHPAVMLHALSAASAMARGFVSSVKAGPPVLPLLVVCAEAPPPCWMVRDWEILEGVNDLHHSPQILDHPQQRAALRRRERLRKMLDPEQMLIPRVYDILASKRLCLGRSVVTHGTRKLAAPCASHPLTHLCASLPRARAVLLRTCRGASPGESLIGCVGTREFTQLVKDQGHLLASRVGLMLSVPCSQPTEFARIDPHCPTSLINQCLVRHHQGRRPFVYDPEPESAKALDEHAAQRESWDLPEVLRPLLPDPARVWHMATLFAALCHREDPTAGAYSAALAMTFDGWATAQHLHLIKLSYPADVRGWFEATDLAVFRQLGEQPQRLRDIQRRLRGVRSDSCLASLRRAIDAGLAVERPGGLYQLPPPPPFEG